MKKNLFPWKKILLSAIIILVAAVFLIPGGTVHAQTTTSPINFVTCVGAGTATCVVYYGVYIVRQILMSFFAFAVGVFLSFLNLTSHVIDSPMVQNGFSICLSIANLAFVLGLIVIAIATIIRNQTYGMKQILWKLVVMAILVNFGLVIAAPILSFANILTQNFINAAGGTSLGANMAKAMNPQLEDAALTQLQKQTTALNSAGISACASLTATTNVASTLVCVVGGLFTGWGGGTTDVIQNITVAMAGQVVILSVMDFALLAAAILLLVRYIWLVIACITLPFAWVAWVFPRYNSEFGKWWDNFIKWAFFPVIFAFFLYLTIQISLASSNQYLVNSLSGITGPVNTSGQSQSVCTTGSTSDCYVNVGIDILDQIALCGLLIGGLFAASSLAGKAGNVAVGIGKSASGAVTGYVGRKTKAGAQKSARLAYQKAGGEKLNKALQENRGLQWTRRIPVLGGVVRRGATLAGRGLASVSVDSSAVDEAKKSVPKDRENVLSNLKGSLSTKDALAHLDAAVKGKYLKEDTMVNGQKAKDYLDQNRDIIKRYGQGKTLEDANKLFMSDSNYRAGEKAAAEKEARENTVREDARKKAIARGANKEDAKKAGDEAVKKSQEELDEKAKEAHDQTYARVYKETKNGAVGKAASAKEKSQGGSDAEAEAAADKVAKAVAERAAEVAAAEVSGAVVRVVDDIKDDFGKVIYKAGDRIDSKKLMDVAMQQFIKGLTPADAEKMDVNTLFGPAAAKEAVETRLRNIALYNAKLMPNLYKNMKFATIRNVDSKYIKAISDRANELSEEIKDINKDASLGEAAKKERVAEREFLKKRLTAAAEAFEKIQSSSLTYAGGVSGEEEKKKDDNNPTPAAKP